MEIQKQMDIIKSIKDNLGSSTGTNFESKVHHVLGRYYNYVGKIFSRHSSAGGDCGNDGWIEDERLFYQIYAPQQKSSKSLKRRGFLFGHAKDTLTSVPSSESPTTLPYKPLYCFSVLFALTRATNLISCLS